jgi:hypothetical protein
MPAFKIYFNGYKDKVSTAYVSYEARNLGNFDYAISTPVSVFGLPEFYIEGAIVTKSEGNTGTINFQWVIKDEETTPFVTKDTWNTILPKVTADEFYPDSKAWDGNSSSNSGNNYKSRRIFTVADDDVYETFDTLTADGQMIALSEYFEKRGITSAERHRIIIKDEASNKYIVNLEGVITRLSFQKSGTDPVTWNATIAFQIGDVIDSGE